MVLIAALILAAAPPRVLSLPRGAQISARLLDFVDSSHEPVGQTFRAVVTKPVGEERAPAIQKGARLLVRLVSTGRNALTLDLQGVQLGAEEWASFRPDGGGSRLIARAVARPKAAPGARLYDAHVYVPARSELVFSLETAVVLEIAPFSRGYR
jgi:hypothetical protein